MDPDYTCRAIIASDDPVEREELMIILHEWIGNGGFRPDTDLFEQAMSAMGGEWL